MACDISRGLVWLESAFPFSVRELCDTLTRMGNEEKEIEGIICYQLFHIVPSASADWESAAPKNSGHSGSTTWQLQTISIILGS